MFADLFQDVGRRSIPPRIVAVVMALQRADGLSDREAVDRFSFDLRWKFAAGGLDYDYPGFVHTVLVDMRARLRNSNRPDRIFELILEVCRAAGLVGRKRVLDSTALYDAVATHDTTTLIRSAACLHDRKLRDDVRQAGELLATVVGQDLEQTEDGQFRIARRVAEDRVISTVDPEARHGHKTAARSFDGYKGHISIDPDSEVIVTNDVTPGNVGDGQAAGPLLDEALAEAKAHSDEESPIEVFGDAC